MAGRRESTSSPFESCVKKRHGPPVTVGTEVLETSLEVAEPFNLWLTGDWRASLFWMIRTSDVPGVRRLNIGVSSA